MSEIVEAVTAYLAHVSDHLAVRLGTVDADGPRPGRIRPISYAVRAWFEECESHSSWAVLRRACAQTFVSYGHSRGEWGWRQGLEHWFRRGGTYLKCVEGTKVDPMAIVESLESDLAASEDRVGMLSLLEGVRFTESDMDFGEFQVLRPGVESLKSFLGIPVNQVFYPHAVTSADRLTDHWYLRVETRQRRRKLGLLYPEFKTEGPVRPSYSEFHPEMEKALKGVVLWDWRPDFLEPPQEELRGQDRWEGFSIPFVLTISDNLFEAPPPAPPVSKLWYEPVCDDAGEEIGESPTYWYNLDADATAGFRGFIQDVVSKLRSFFETGEAWQFIDRGLGYLVKGFFANGLEQMLWHIIALEALLGERGPAVSRRLSRRLAAVYSKHEGRSEEARKAFEELYELRASLVHGQAFRKEAHSGHLRIARLLARTAAIRMMDLLDNLLKERKEEHLTYIPTREEILMTLDHEEASRGRLAELLRVMARPVR